MTELLTLRASGMPLAFKCGGSVRLPFLRVAETHEAATLGTATHEALRPLAERGSVDWDGLPALSARHGVDFAELRLLVAVGAKLWAQVAASFPEAMTEVDVVATLPGGHMLPGHIDLLSMQGTVARFGDWKTGRKDSDYSEQMRAYGAGLLIENPELTSVTGTVLWLRDGEIENYTMTRGDALEWVRRVDDEVVNWDGVFRPGGHCGYCPRSHECDAATVMVRRDVAMMTDRALVTRAECELNLMAPAEVVAIYEKATLVEGYAKRVRDAVKAHVLAHGAIEADGAKLVIEAEPRRELDPLRAWPVLDAAGFVDEDFAACMKLGVSKVEKRVAEKAGRGKGAGAVRALKAALDEAHAIEVSEVQKLHVRRA